MLIALLSSFAFADSITLDTGATIEGDLARYEFGGDCQLSVTDGDLAGVILIVPCHRVVSFVRTTPRTPVPIGLEEEAARRETVAAAPAPAVPTAPAPVTAPAPPPAPPPAPVAAAPSAPVDGPTVLFGSIVTPPAPAVAASEPDPAPVALAPLPPSEVREEPFYDEPLFPADATTPITPAAPSAAPTIAPIAPAPLQTSGPRLAPRMDEPVEPEPERRAVSF